MKTFKDFAGQINELMGVAPKSKKEHEFVHSTYMAQVKDPGDLEKVGPEEVGPEGVKSGSGKRPADRLDNKQKFGESKDSKEKMDDEDDEYEDEDDEEDKKESKKKMNGVKEGMKSFKQFKSSVNEADFTKQQTKMAHTIGKEFEKKGVGDESKGGPYAVASAMVKDKPEAAKKAYDTIKAKMKEEADAEILFNLYNDLNEENQEFFLVQLEEDAESLLVFAKNLISE
jgi:hypothetical protein